MYMNILSCRENDVSEDCIRIVLLIVSPSLSVTQIGSSVSDEPPPMLQTPYTPSTVDSTKKDGIPMGKGHRHSYSETCFNANQLVLNSYVKQSRMFRRSGPWDETHICVELLAANTLNDDVKLDVDETDSRSSSSGGGNTNVETTGTKFRTECENLLGVICRRQCTVLAQLYDVWDYRTWPPKLARRSNEVSLGECVACLQFSDCAQRPLLRGAESTYALDSKPWGDSQGARELVPEVFAGGGG